MINEPVVNQVVKGRDLGRNPPSGNFMWTQCPKCQQYRWAIMLKGKPKAIMCQHCTRLGSKRTFSDEHCHRLSLSKLGDKNPQKRFMGRKNSHWKGGRSVRRDGYVQVYLDNDDFFFPMCSHLHYVMEHRLVMARHLNRCLLPWESVHHKNAKRNDNRIENLELFPAPHKHNGITKMQTYIKQLEGRIKVLEQQSNVKNYTD